MTSMTDRNGAGNNFINKLLQAFYASTTTFTITPGTGGGSAFTITPPFLLALLTAIGSDTANGTEATAVNCPGYLTLASGSAQHVTFAAPSAGVIASSNTQSYSATASWSTITSMEIWDSAATKLRYLQGALSASITGVANGDTVQFAIGAISADWSQG